MEDIRWKRRFNNFSKALGQLTKFIEKGQLNELEEQGLIQAFEYTYELAWNVLKDFFAYQGETEIRGSRDAFRMAFNRGIIQEGQIWMEMIRSRTLTSHTYNEEMARKIAADVVNRYFPEFVKFHSYMEKLKDSS